MSRATLILGSSLALSVAANAWLLARGDEPNRSAPPAQADRHVAHSAAMPSEPTPAAAHPAPPATCESRLTATRAHIAHLTKEVERHRQLDDRFASVPRATANERVLGEELARVWKGAPDWMTWQTECHGLVCRVDIGDQDGDPPFDWLRKVQADITPGLTHGMSFSAFDSKTHEYLGHQRIYVSLAEPGDFPGDALLDRIERTFENGDAEEDCAKRDPTAGTLDVDLTVDPVARTIGVDARGSLAGTASGKCLLDALGAIISAHPVPLNATAATSHFSVTMPPR
jgi:hypothetical protein